MKILFFIQSMTMGGAERVTANLANFWAEKNFEVAVATLSDASSDFYELHPKIKRISLNTAENRYEGPFSPIVNNLPRIHSIRKVLINWKPDIAIGIMALSNVLLAMAAIGVQNIVTIGSERIHPPMYHIGLNWQIARRILYRKLHAVVALTQPSADWLKRNTRPRMLKIIPNPILWPLPSCTPTLQPSTIIKQNRKLLLAAGRLDSQKGFDMLLNAFNLVAAENPIWDLVILGEGAERKALENQVARLGLLNRVFLPGKAGNIADWYKAADLYVMSSRFEGFPNALAEAMAHALPVVSFDCPTGPADIIRHEIDGLLVPPQDVKALANALSRLMQDESLRHKFSKRAIEAKERFSLPKIAGMWEQLFEELHNDSARRI